MTTPNTPTPAQNTDRELWRERPDDYYADSIHVTTSGGIGFNCGGHVIVKPLRAWHGLAGDLTAALKRAEEAERDAERWRWFKANCGWEWHGPDSWKWYTLVPFSPQKDGDAAIDAAIAAAIREAVKP